MFTREVEQVKKVANGRRVGWNIFADRGVVRRVWQIIAAAPGDLREAPVMFDELQNRNMVRITCADIVGKGRYSLSADGLHTFGYFDTAENLKPARKATSQCPKRSMKPAP